ncbi:MAG: hypothetical protein R3E64_02205 [Halioglobus sp.]
MRIISLRRTFSKATYYYLLYGFAFLVMLAACWQIVESGHQLRQLEVRDYSIRRCDFPSNPGGPVLRVLDAVYMEDLDLLSSTWCQTPALAEHYGSLELRSVHRDHFDLRELYDARYQLILAKPELISSGGRARKDGIGYEMIAQYPDYGSQLVSLQGTPELTAAWMKGKTLGLLDDPNSVSAYQIPKAALHRKGLADVPTIIYFRSYRQLYRALFEGEVDIIPALLSDEGVGSALKLPDGLVLEETIPGPAWYMHRDLLQAPAGCILLTALQQLARHARFDYFRDLKIVRPCNAD